MEKKSVLFICKNNSGRSQMAEGLLKHFNGNIYDVYSAGIDPKPLNPLTIEIMAEVGININHQFSKNISIYKDQKFDYAIILCSENCPQFVKAKKYIQYQFKDPKTYLSTDMDRKDVFINIRDEIEDWIKNSLLKELNKE